MSDLDLDELVHTPEGRMVIEVLQGRRLPVMVVMQDRGEMTFWYPKLVQEGLRETDRLMEWVRLLEEHVKQLQERAVKQ